MDLTDLKNIALAKPTELADLSDRLVFGAGSADADLMIIGEAPGADEDAAGLPFVAVPASCWIRSSRASGCSATAYM